MANHETDGKFSKTWLQCVTVTLSSAIFVFVAVLVQATSSGWTDGVLAGSRLAALDVSTTLGLLRGLQGLLSILTSAGLEKSFLLLVWGLMDGPSGLGYPTLLALSTTTGYLGAAKIVFSRIAKRPAKLWALFRITLGLATTLSGIVLFVHTSIVTVYDRADTYDVTAGVGPFNASYVAPLLEKLQAVTPQYRSKVVPYSYTAAAYSLVTNQMYSTVYDPVRCAGASCRSYLISGGLIMLTPWMPSTYLSYPMIMVHNAPSVQVEFLHSEDPGHFSEADCSIFGSPGVLIGARFCVRKSEGNAGLIDTGLYVCPNGTDGSRCRSSEALPNITTTVAFYTRLATVIASRSNYSIMDVSDLTPAVSVPDIDISAYRSVFDWLLNYTAANIPAPSSIVENFWSNRAELQDPSASVAVFHNFESIIAFPFWFFNANNFGNVDLRAKEMVKTLPPEFYTQASIVAPRETIRFNRDMFVVFAVLEGLALIFIWAILVWFWAAIKARRLPVFSSYPLFDVTYKAKTHVAGDTGEIVTADDNKTLESVKEWRVYTWNIDDAASTSTEITPRIRY